MFDQVTLVVMAGGTGSRFWPKSTPQLPKQLLAFFDQEQTLLENTLKRFSEVISPERRWIVTTELLKKTILEHVHGQATVFAEPVGKNTAPCLFWMAQKLFEKDPHALVLVTPADHFFLEEKKLLQTLKKAISWVREHETLMVFGVEPTRPETGYGYIEIEKIEGSRKEAPFFVRSFCEKPSLEKAQKYLQTKRHFWNSGIFLCRVDVLLEAFRTYLPQYFQYWERGTLSTFYQQVDALSIDYGILEKAQNVSMGMLSCPWDDLGSWNAVDLLWRKKHHQALDENAVLSGSVRTIDSKGNFIDVPGMKVGLVGVKDLVIVESGGKLLVAKKDCVQKVREISKQRWD